jgi:hypothetical protein
MKLDERFGAGVAIMTYRTTLETEYDKLKAVREEWRAQARVAVEAQDEAVQFFKNHVLGSLSKAVDSAIEAAEPNALAKNLGLLRADIRKRMSDSRTSAVVLDNLRAKANREVARLAELRRRYDETYARCEAAIPEAKRYIETGADVPARFRPFFVSEKSDAVKITPLSMPSQDAQVVDPVSTAAMAWLGRVPQPK